MQITGSYQGYTKQQNLAALQNFLKQQQNTASTPNSQSGQSKKDSAEISQQGQQALQQALRAGSLNNLSGLTQSERDALRDARQRELRQNIDEYYLRELTPEQKKEQQLANNLDITSRELNRLDEFNDEFKNVIEYAMNKLGIDFQDMNEIEIGLNNGRMTVSGLKSESDNKKLAEELSRIASLPLFGNKFFTSLDESVRIPPSIQQMFYRNTDYAMSADDEQERNYRAYLIFLKDYADRTTKESGVDFSQLYRTEDGKIAGYPEKAAWYFETDITTLAEGTYAAGAISHAVTRMCDYANRFLDAGYDNIPNLNEMNVVFNFNKGSFVNPNASA